MTVLHGKDIICSNQVRIRFYAFERISELQHILKEINKALILEYDDQRLKDALKRTESELSLNLQILDHLDQDEVAYGYKIIMINDVMNS